MTEILQYIKSIITTMGVSVLLPVLLLIIFLILKTPFRTSIFQAVKLGVGFQGIILIINAYVTFITPIFEKMVNITGIDLPVLDIGWAPVMVVSYATTLGIIYIGIGIVLQLFLFFIRWTNILQITDVVNIYSYPIWGLITYQLTGSFLQSICVMITINVFTLTITEIVAKRWSSYYKIPGGVCTIPHEMGTIPVTLFTSAVLNKIKLGNINISTTTLKDKWGFFGEPIFLGFLSGLLIGFLGNVRHFFTIKSIVEIITVGMATGAVAVVFPKAAALIGEVFGSLAESIKKWVLKRGEKREIYFAVNDAVGFGEPNNFLCALMSIPIIIFLAFLLPGNKVMPLVDLVGVAYTINIISAINKGNIFKTLICTIVYYGLGLYAGTYIAPLFTNIAASTNAITLPAGFITSLNLLCKPILLLIAYPFMKASFSGILLIILIYFTLFYVVKKFRGNIEDYIETKL
jgi:PTS system galactitol-specific IIC component